MKDRVIFRKWNDDGGIIALLPDNPACPGMIDMYEHIGQHGEGCPEIVQTTTLATPSEYKDLLEELTSIGYDLRVMKRINR